MHNKIAKHAGGVGFATLISRILGYIRDMLIANMFGATLAADAFYVAYRIPNLLRRLLGENSLSSSFIPVFTEYITNKSKKEAEELINVTISVLLIILAACTLIGIVLAPLIVRLIAPGFINNPEKLHLTIKLTRIMFPFMTAIGLAALTMGILNSLHKFIIPAFASCWLSIAEIFFVLAVCPLMETPIVGLAVGVLIGGFAQLFFQVPFIIKNNFFIRFKIDLNNAGLRRIGYLMLPATIGLSVNQINTFADTICASFLKEGSVTALYYSNRLVQFPLALFGTAVATVTLPAMSKSIALKNMGEMKNILSLSLRMIMLLIIPASIGLIVLGEPIIKILFERGMFDAEATKITYFALFFYSFGLLADASVKIMVSAFYSFQDTRTPVKIAALCMGVNIILNIVLMRFLQVGGLALATTIASIVNMVLLIKFLRKRVGNLQGRLIMESFFKIMAAGLIMGVVCYFTSVYLIENKYIKVLVPLLLSVVVFFTLTYVFKIKEIKPLWSLVRRGKGRG